MNTADCGFCGEGRDASAMIRGGKAFICGGCLGAGLTWSIASRGASPSAEIPESDRPCTFCQKKAPASALFSRRDGCAICTACLSRGFWFFAHTAELQERRQTWRFLDDKAPIGLLEAHFQGIELDEIVTSSRRFPEYMRVDLNKTLEVLLPASVRCVGLHQQYGHETLEFGTVTSKEGRVSIAPLQYDELDIGEASPARCLRRGLWFAEDDGTPHAVLVTQAQTYGQSSGWHVEIAVPPGERGERVVRRYFTAIEGALSAAASYRGKVLSLEASQRVQGTGALVTVHRIASVARDEIVLPTSTLELLERNVFKFAGHRKALAEMGLPVKKGLLFYGPPGTGKTHTIRYLASALPGHTTLLVTAEQVGLIEHYMTLARLLSPSILVIEDADLIARQREEMAGACEEVLLNRLLNEMDGLKESAEIIFVLTTNRPESLEMALRARPGRIDQSIEFPLPDTEGRMKLARLYGKGAPLAEETLQHIVERTAKVSAAFIKELMRRSTQFALERGSKTVITSADVDAALDEMLFTGGRLNAALLGASEARPT
jgi:histone H3/H4